QPDCPNDVIQQSVVRNGGNASARTANAMKHRRQRRLSPFRNNADASPIAAARKAVNALTSRLFLSSVQFTQQSRTGVPPVCPMRSRDQVSTGKTSVLPGRTPGALT